MHKPEENVPDGPLLGNTPAPAQEGPVKRLLHRATAFAPTLANLVSDAVYELVNPPAEPEVAKEWEKRPVSINHLKAQNIVNSLSKNARNQIVGIVKSRGRNRHTRRATEAIIRRDARRQDKLSKKHLARAEGKIERDIVLVQRIHTRLVRGLNRPFPGMSEQRYIQLLGQVDFGGDRTT